MSGKPHPRVRVTQPQDPSYRIIPLTQNKVALVDTEDYEWASQWNWYAQWNECTKSYYAGRNPRVGDPPNTPQHLHTALLRVSPERVVDHRNGDTLDDRKHNLRECSTLQNSRNRMRSRNNKTGLKGVHFETSSGKWKAQIGVAWKRYNLGRYDTVEAAGRAYDEAAIKHFGEFARLNFPKV
jgi:hypothetical protein